MDHGGQYQEVICYFVGFLGALCSWRAPECQFVPVRRQIEHQILSMIMVKLLGRYGDYYLQKKKKRCKMTSTQREVDPGLPARIIQEASAESLPRNLAAIPLSH